MNKTKREEDLILLFEKAKNIFTIGEYRQSDLINELLNNQSYESFELYQAFENKLSLEVKMQTCNNKVILSIYDQLNCKSQEKDLARYSLQSSFKIKNNFYIEVHNYELFIEIENLLTQVDSYVILSNIKQQQLPFILRFGQSIQKDKFSIMLSQLIKKLPSFDHLQQIEVDFGNNLVSEFLTKQLQLVTNKFINLNSLTYIYNSNNESFENIHNLLSISNKNIDNLSLKFEQCNFSSNEIQIISKTLQNLIQLQKFQLVCKGKSLTETNIENMKLILRKRNLKELKLHIKKRFKYYYYTSKKGSSYNLPNNTKLNIELIDLITTDLDFISIESLFSLQSFYIDMSNSTQRDLALKQVKKLSVNCKQLSKFSFKHDTTCYGEYNAEFDPLNDDQVIVVANILEDMYNLQKLDINMKGLDYCLLICKQIIKLKNLQKLKLDLEAETNYDYFLEEFINIQNVLVIFFDTSQMSRSIRESYFEKNQLETNNLYLNIKNCGDEVIDWVQKYNKIKETTSLTIKSCDEEEDNREYILFPKNLQGCFNIFNHVYLLDLSIESYHLADNMNILLDKNGLFQKKISDFKYLNSFSLKFQIYHCHERVGDQIFTIMKNIIIKNNKRLINFKIQLFEH